MDTRNANKGGMVNPPRRRSQIFFILTILVFVVVPFLFWRGTWFGTELTEEQIGRYLAEGERPRRVQHALSQIETRIVNGDPRVKVWYPEVLKLTAHPSKEVRITLAWVMGQDSAYDPFHQALLQLARDPEPMVRRNAALSLVRFGDPSGKAEILAMLRSYPVNSNGPGTISMLVAAGDSCEHGALLARIRDGQNSLDLVAPISGHVDELRIHDGDSVSANQTVLTLLSDDNQVWEALRALYLIGTGEDMTILAAFTTTKYPDRVRRQAKETIERIRGAPR